MVFQSFLLLEILQYKGILPWLGLHSPEEHRNLTNNFYLFLSTL